MDILLPENVPKWGGWQREAEKPANESRKVDFPEPEGPMTAKIRPIWAYPLSWFSSFLLEPAGTDTVKSFHTR